MSRISGHSRENSGQRLYPPQKRIDLASNGLTRLIQSDESTAWKRLALSKLSSALRISNLTSTRLLSESPHTIASAASALSNPFWQNLLKLLPQLERTFYEQNTKLIGEQSVWNRKDIVMANGKPFDRKTSSTSLAALTTISSFLSAKTNVLMNREEAAKLIGEGNLGTWNELVESITSHLTSKNLTWYSVNHPDPGPRHLGWSRICLLYTSPSPRDQRGSRLPSFS